VAYELNSLLGRLVGFRLYSVEFVLDYVQLRFDGPDSADQPVLTCYALPAVVLGEHRHRADQPGWADAVRGLIGQDVTATQEATGVGLRLDLPGGSLQLHPTAAELCGPEIAMLDGFGDRAWMCWRPGEDAFEDL
jgi:hypothetical protein